MDYQKQIKNLTLNKSDFYTGKIIIQKTSGDFTLKNNSNYIIQTDAKDNKKEYEYTIYKNYNYILIRKFKNHKNIENELCYNVDDLIDLGIKIEDLFPIYPTIEVMAEYLKGVNVSDKQKSKCLSMTKMLNKGK